MPNGENGFRIIHVAPPTSHVGTRPYFTSSNDFIINVLRKTLKSVLPANIEIPKDLKMFFKDPLGHSFLGVYLNPRSTTYKPIRDALIQAYNSVKKPDTHGNEGYFTVTLTWDGFGDVDLHIFEPPGSHVYFLQKEGILGYLDIDNIYGYGPEHYYATCHLGANEIREGIYSFSVHNYNDADERIATVQLTTGLQSFVPVTITMAPSGSDLQHAFIVEVTKNPNYEPNKTWEPEYLVQIK